MKRSIQTNLYTSFIATRGKQSIRLALKVIRSLTNTFIILKLLHNNRFITCKVYSLLSLVLWIVRWGLATCNTSDMQIWSRSWDTTFLAPVLIKSVDIFILIAQTFHVDQVNPTILSFQKKICIVRNSVCAIICCK